MSSYLAHIASDLFFNPSKLIVGVVHRVLFNNTLKIVPAQNVNKRFHTTHITQCIPLPRRRIPTHMLQLTTTAGLYVLMLLGYFYYNVFFCAIIYLFELN